MFGSAPSWKAHELGVIGYKFYRSVPNFWNVNVI